MPASRGAAKAFQNLQGRQSVTPPVVGVDMEPIAIPGVSFINGRKRLQGWAAGTPSDSEDTLRFATLTGVRPMIEKFPLERAADAYARMLSGHAQFRVVLTM